MAGKPHRPASSKPVQPARVDPDRMPTQAELLHELRKHGAKPPPRAEPPRFSRRMRDFLLLAGVGSAAIGFACFRVLTDSDSATVLRLALTGIALFCGMLWFIFYGVMSRY
jgi:hypothetical protein